jgi:hypothetical protein
MPYTDFKPSALPCNLEAQPMSFCVTRLGTILYYDESRNIVTHGKINTSPKNLVIRLSESSAYFLVKKRKNIVIPLKSDSLPNGLSFQIREADRGVSWTVPSELAEMFDGDLKRSDQSADSDDFQGILIDENALEKLTNLLTADWFDTSTKQLLRSSKVEWINDFKFTMGYLNIDIGDLIKLFADSKSESVFDGLSLIVIHDGWRITRLLKYKPLIYVCAFGADSIFEYLRIYLSSIHRHAEYEGDILIMTDRAPDEISKYLPQEVRSSIRVLSRNPKSAREIGSARYTIAMEDVSDYQPILYSDIDMVCDNHLQPLLFALLEHDRICYVPEFPGKSVHSIAPEVGPWFGDFLFREDQSCADFDPQCLNSGVLGFRNQSVVDRVFPAIRNSHLAFRFSQPPRFQDQPFASYVIQKLKVGNGKILPAFVSMVTQTSPFGFPRKGLAHFYGGFGYGGKVELMESYSLYLEKLVE